MTITTASQGILDKIHEHGYWRVVISPTRFEQYRIPKLKECEEIVQSNSVRLRGWDYPHITNQVVGRGNDWIEASYDGLSKGLPYIEFWRFFQSGQFVHHFACWEDYQKVQDVYPHVVLEKNIPFLSIVSTLFTLTEIFEFASRIAHRGALTEAVEISISLFGLKGRALIFSGDRVFSQVNQSKIDEIIYPPRLLSTTELLAGAQEYALDAAEWIFERFDFSMPRELLAQDQQRLLQRNL